MKICSVPYMEPCVSLLYFVLGTADRHVRVQNVSQDETKEAFDPPDCSQNLIKA